jgi:hypothetical protein
MKIMENDPKNSLFVGMLAVSAVAGLSLLFYLSGGPQMAMVFITGFLLAAFLSMLVFGVGE